MTGWGGWPRTSRKSESSPRLCDSHSNRFFFFPYKIQSIRYVWSAEIDEKIFSRQWGTCKKRNFPNRSAILILLINDLLFALLMLIHDCPHLLPCFLEDNSIIYFSSFYSFVLCNPPTTIFIYFFYLFNSYLLNKLR